jgi:hypothetical protein
MEKEFVPYEQALALKELGFDELCFATYNSNNKVSRNPSHNMEDLPIEGQPYYWNNSKIHKNTVTAPTFSQAFRFFREKCGLQAEILWRGDMGCFCYKTGKFKYGSHDFSKDDYETYEEAELECLKKLIEIVKKINKMFDDTIYIPGSKCYDNWSWWYDCEDINNKVEILKKKRNKNERIDLCKSKEL